MGYLVCYHCDDFMGDLLLDFPFLGSGDGRGEMSAFLIQSPYCLHMLCTPSSVGPSQAFSALTHCSRGAFLKSEPSESLPAAQSLSVAPTNVRMRPTSSLAGSRPLPASWLLPFLQSSGRRQVSEPRTVRLSSLPLLTVLSLLRIVPTLCPYT